jgi:dienelactone hydrolase/ketosteroid isomerase-like protein
MKKYCSPLFIILISITSVLAQSAIAISKIDSNRREMYKYIQKNDVASIANFYAPDASIDGFDAKLQGLAPIKDYWRNVRGKGIDWSWEIFNTSGDNDFVFQTGISHLTLAYNDKNITYSSFFSVIWQKQADGDYKILSDFYRPHDQFSTPSYKIEKDSVWINTGKDSLFAVIFKPNTLKNKKLPAIYCLQGGGNVGIDNYYYEAELFASVGIVSLVCDKAGAGKSKGKSSWITQTFKEKVEEYSSVLNWLMQQSYVDTSQIGIHGPSEGGRLALSVALANPSKIKFVNAVSAPLETLKENQLYAIEKLLLSKGYAYSVIAQTLGLFNDYFDAIKARNISEDLMFRVNQLRAKYPNLYLPLNSTKLPRMPQSDDIDYTFGSDLNQINCPIFFQYGSDDAVVNVSKSLKYIPKKDNIELKIYKNTDHSINYPNGDIHGGYHLDKIKWIFSILR